MSVMGRKNIEIINKDKMMKKFLGKGIKEY